MDTTHLLTPDLLPACDTRTPNSDGRYHLTPVAADVTCPECIEWVHA